MPLKSEKSQSSITINAFYFQLHLRLGIYFPFGGQKLNFHGEKKGNAESVYFHWSTTYELKNINIFLFKKSAVR